MKKLTKREGIAVCAGLALLTYLFFSGPLLNLFTTQTKDLTNNTMPQTGFEAEDVVVGTGTIAQRGDKITAHYVGMLTSGRVFDSSHDRGVPIDFTLGTGQVIRGWDEGLVGMRVGGKRILRIAPDYGYGSQAVGAIPANSPLIFEVELLKVNGAE